MKYTLKKLSSTIVTLIVVSLCVFLAFNVLPGDPAIRMLGLEASPELVAQTREKMGLNDPVLVRYFRWFIAFLQGDFGTSYTYSVPVSSLIMSKVPITLTLGILAFLFTVGVEFYSNAHAKTTKENYDSALKNGELKPVVKFY